MLIVKHKIPIMTRTLFFVNQKLFEFLLNSIWIWLFCFSKSKPENKIKFDFFPIWLTDWISWESRFPLQLKPPPPPNISPNQFSDCSLWISICQIWSFSPNQNVPLTAKDTRIKMCCTLVPIGSSEIKSYWITQMYRLHYFFIYYRTKLYLYLCTYR